MLTVLVSTFGKELKVGAEEIGNYLRKLDIKIQSPSFPFRSIEPMICWMMILQNKNGTLDILGKEWAVGNMTFIANVTEGYLDLLIPKHVGYKFEIIEEGNITVVHNSDDEINGTRIKLADASVITHSSRLLVGYGKVAGVIYKLQGRMQLQVGDINLNCGNDLGCDQSQKKRDGRMEEIQISSASHISKFEIAKFSIIAQSGWPNQFGVSGPFKFAIRNYSIADFGF